MPSVRDKIENAFAAMARYLFENRIKALLVLLILSAGLFVHLPDITIDTSTEGFLHEKDPALIAYNTFRDQFGRDEMVIVAIAAPDIFSPPFLSKLKKLHTALADQVPYLDDITSLINARNTRGEKDTLIVEDLLENWPETEKELARVKQRAMDNPMYRNMLISEDGRFTTIVLQTQTYTSQGEPVDVLAGFDEGFGEEDEPEEMAYLTDAENSEVVAKVKEITAAFQAEDFDIYVAGSPVVTDYLKRAMMKDMRKFLAMALITIMIFLWAMFRRVSGVLLPVMVVILSLLGTISLMALFGKAIKLPTQILPSFLLAVSVGDSVHILAIFFHRFNRNAGDKKEAVVYAVGHSGLAVLMTSLTTAAGLFSFATADIAPIADLGVFAGLGVLLALFYTLFLLPPALALIPVKSKSVTREKSRQPMVDRLLESIGKIATAHPKIILALAAIVTVVSVAGLFRVRFSHDVVKWYPKTADVRIATETIDAALKGSITLEILIDTQKINGLYDPSFLKRLNKAAIYLENLEKGHVAAGKAWSIATILKEIHQALNENRPAYYAIPDDATLIAQEFLLFENSGSDDLEDVTDSQFSKARLTIKLPFEDAVAYNDFIDEVNRYVRDTFPGTRITTTGMISLLFQTVTNVIHSMAKSYGIALVVITLFMVVLIGRLRIGMLSMIPNLFPILLTIGIMGWFGVAMDLFTMLVGSIAIGLAVDDTVHFMHNFRRYHDETGDPEAAVMATLHSTGRAMLVTTCVLSAGFFLFMFSSMHNIFNFGWLTGFTIIMALLSDYFIAPALMVLANPKKPESGQKGM